MLSAAPSLQHQWGIALCGAEKAKLSQLPNSQTFSQTPAVCIWAGKKKEKASFVGFFSAENALFL